MANALLASASGDAVDGSRTAAVEAAAGLVGRAFASAEVTPANAITAALTPPILADIGWRLIVDGYAVYLLEVEDGAKLLPARSWDIKGGANPASWRYVLTIETPGGDVERRATSAAVVHIRAPGAGLTGGQPSLKVARELAAKTEAKLSEELNQESGAILPYPDPSGSKGTNEDRDKIQAAVKAKIGGLKGKIAALVSQQSEALYLSGQGLQRGSGSDWRSIRLGPEPPQQLVALHRQAFDVLVAAYGISPAIFDPRSDGTSKRESWRQSLHGVIQPLGRIAAAELASKLEAEGLAFSFEKLFASDVTGRARAAASLTAAGVPIDEALERAGFS